MEQFFINAGLSVVWAGIGVILLFIATIVFDLLHPLDLRREIEKGNVAAGILLGAVVIGMAYIIGVAIH